MRAIPGPCLAALACAAALAQLAPAQGRSGADGRRQEEAIDGAIALLAAEARMIKAGHLSPRTEADFARRYPLSIGQEEIAEALARRADQDPFVDAYIRWQLTSFEPALPAFDDRAFARFLHHAPAFVANPRADPKVVTLFERAAESGPLPAAARERLRTTSEQLDSRTAQAERLNEAASGFYEWVEARLDRTGPRLRQWLLHRCAATITAGWPAAPVKAALTRSDTAGSTLTPEQQRMVEVQAEALAGLERTFVDTVTFLADGSVRVSFSTTAVSRLEMERWIEP